MEIMYHLTPSVMKARHAATFAAASLISMLVTVVSCGPTIWFATVVPTNMSWFSAQ